MARCSAAICGSEHFNRHTAAPPHTHHHSAYTATRTSALGKHASQTWIVQLEAMPLRQSSLRSGNPPNPRKAAVMGVVRWGVVRGR